MFGHTRLSAPGTYEMDRTRYLPVPGNILNHQVISALEHALLGNYPAPLARLISLVTSNINDATLNFFASQRGGDHCETSTNTAEIPSEDGHIL
ncbi:hypothetical protein EVAR_4604_1 [Eumeta japonica]|uniref:Uncharacterized protein n=1 Tax=Eumeta variegata TaxID=151549 RepID=A0A4C1SX18_EUMVA|nr:hypothetical protein EVAR_4604_1 [Eumeta japonica]